MNKESQALKNEQNAKKSINSIEEIQLNIFNTLVTKF